MKRIESADWSTINLAELHKLPVYDWRGKGYKLQDDSGNGCAGDPPGFPTYYTRNVYTRSGDDPQHGYTLVIEHDGKAYGIEPANWSGSWEEHRKDYNAMMRRLWQPLPLDHPRTVAWILATFSHHRHCYQVPELVAQGKNWSDAMLIWPGGCLGDTPLGKLRNLDFEIKYAGNYDKWTQEHKNAFVREIQESNAAITAKCEAVATPDNHDGTVIVRRYYPQFNPTPELIAGDFQSPGNWWETLAAKPSPDKCPGQYGHKHPVNGSWCQFCGWHEPKAA